ncbi:hypothetical protein Syun_007885 [Stephania yunnanensis]|uniref:Uncharacterized protein n=1 Tax=Stephania yunnanensis TaxID=152371 RepID=A0AAP0Q0N7_9MAGN
MYQEESSMETLVSSSDDDVILTQETKMGVSERVMKAYEIAKTSLQKKHSTPSSVPSKEIESSRTKNVEDPIRILMFLGSWSHT